MKESTAPNPNVYPFLLLARIQNYGGRGLSIG
jgi:hypothetical protein